MAVGTKGLGSQTHTREEKERVRQSRDGDGDKNDGDDETRVLMSQAKRMFHGLGHVLRRLASARDATDAVDQL